MRQDVRVTVSHAIVRANAIFSHYVVNGRDVTRDPYVSCFRVITSGAVITDLPFNGVNGRHLRARCWDQPVAVWDCRVNR